MTDLQSAQQAESRRRRNQRTATRVERPGLGLGGLGDQLLHAGTDRLEIVGSLEPAVMRGDPEPQSPDRLSRSD